MLIEIKELPRSNPGARGTPPRICNLKCDVCGKTYEKKYAKAQLEAKIHRCSLKCAYAARGLGSRGGKVIIRTCAHCGKELPPKTAGSTHTKLSFCNHKTCYAAWRREHPEEYAENTAAMHTPEVAVKISEKIQTRMQQPDYVHPRQGKPHSQETKDKISRHHKEIGCLLGKKNGMFGHKHTKQAKESMSEKHADLLVKGLQRPYGKNSQKGTFENPLKSNRPAHYKSGWELAFMRWLDLNPAVASWEFESVRIPYYYNEHKRWYVPDFIVTYSDGSRKMYEIKPKEFVNSEKVLLKEQAGKSYCDQQGIDKYEILTGDSLRQMKITPRALAER